MRVLFGWQGWLPRYEHTREPVDSAFFHKRLRLWFINVQWHHNGKPKMSIERFLAEHRGEIFGDD